MRSLSVILCPFLLVLLFYNPAALGYTLTGSDWTYELAPMGESIMVSANTSDTSGALNAILNAMVTWGNAGADFKFTYGGVANNPAPKYDGINQIRWVVPSDTDNWLAMTTWWSSSGKILEADMIFNDKYTWATGDTIPTGSFDVESVALHELGHVLGLGHSSAPAIMQPSISSGLKRRILTSDDTNGILAIYSHALPSPLPDNPPIANAGLDQTVDSADFVTLNGSASYDPDGNTLSYQWKQLSGLPTVSLAGANTATATFTAPDVLSQTTLTFGLTVTANSKSASDTTGVTVTPPPAPPSVDDVTVEAFVSSKSSCTMTVKLKATSTLQPTARLTYMVKSDHITKSGTLYYNSTYRIYTAYVYGLPIAPYTVEVQSDAGGEDTTTVGSYNTPEDVLDINVTPLYVYYGKTYLRLSATSTQQPYACLNYKLVNTATGATIKQGLMYYSSTRGYYYTSAYLYPGTYQITAWSTYGGSQSEVFTVQ